MNPDDPLFNALLSIAILAVAIPAMFALISLLISRAGWAKLAQHYRRDIPPRGRRYGSLYMMVGSLVQYKDTITAILSSEGLHLRQMLFFRLGHPPILLPWEAVTDVTEDKILMRKYSLLKIDHLGVQAKIRFPLKALEDIHEAMGAGVSVSG